MTTRMRPRPLENSAVEAVPSTWMGESTTSTAHEARFSISEVEQISKRVNELDDLERARILRALSPAAPDHHLPGGRVLVARNRIVCFLALCCLFLIPWTIGLALTLPRSYLVGNWPLAWTGFDIILLGCLGTTAWALWKQRQVAVVASLITSVLLLCDAWFDVVTAHSGRCLDLSITTAVFGEIPIAVLLGLVSVRLLRASGRLVQRIGVPSTSLWRTPLEPPLRIAMRSDRASAATTSVASAVEDLESDTLRRAAS
jgi:hypothetical protein